LLDSLECNTRVLDKHMGVFYR